MTTMTGTQRQTLLIAINDARLDIHSINRSITMAGLIELAEQSGATEVAAELTQAQACVRTIDALRMALRLLSARVLMGTVN